jgi:transcriptional regulator with XRE-family HTH domain
MSSRELKPLRAVLKRAVAAARLHRRTVEQALDLPPGAWDDLIAGKRILRVRHLLALARLLGVPPEDFLETALPEASRTADRRLADWIEPAQPRFASPQPAGDDWQALVKEAVRRELDALREDGGRSSG